MLWLVTPVYGREELTRVCLAQRARMLDELAALGVEARQLIVGDDGNLDTAREHDFTVLERPNPVGLRVNEGFEWACREGGATHVAYCGSDDWHLASYFAEVYDDAVKTSRLQGFVSPDGRRLVVIEGTGACGGAPWVIPAALLAHCGYRPSNDKGTRAIDASIADSVIAGAVSLARAGGVAKRDALRRLFRFDGAADKLRMVDFKGGGQQITPYERIVTPNREVVLDSRKPFQTLGRCYPADLCEEMARFYASREAA